MARQERAAAIPSAPFDLSRLADGIVEAGWLLALAITPVFFNIQSGRPFEPDKTALLRLLALLMATASLARFVEERRTGLAKAASARWRETPLLVCAAVYLASAVLSTVFSVDPRRSLWGSYTRLEGLVTLLAHLTVFASIATRLTRRTQVDRLLSVVIATSVPVCLYGFLQRLGHDPLDWQVFSFQEGRITSTLGNPVFAGEYLALVLLTTLGAALWWWNRRAETRGSLRVALAVVAAPMQLAALGFTARGPWLGAAAGLGALLLLLAAVHGRRPLAVATLAAGLCGLVFVGVLNVPGGPLEPLRRGAALGRLGRLFADRENRNPADRARVLIWQGALRLARLPAPLVVPGRGPDSAAALRGIVGFGPETFYGVFGQVFDPAFAAVERRNPDVSAEGASTFSMRVPDRSHNETLDSLVFAGIVGLLAYLLLHGAAQYTGLRALGLVATRYERGLLAAAALAGALAVTGIAAGALSWAYVGVAVPLGLVAGLFVYVLFAALRAEVVTPAPEAALVAAVTAALIGVFVSMQFGPTVVTGRLYFWALAGLLVALARVPAADPEPADEGTPAGDTARAGLPALALGLAIAYGFAGVKASGGGQPAYGVMAALAGSAIALAILLTARSWCAAALAAGTVVTLTAAFALFHVHALEATAQVGSLAELKASLSGHFTRVTVLLLACAIALGVALGREAGRRLVGGGALPLAAALTVVLGLAVPATVASVNADVLRHFASMFQAQNRLALAVGLYEEATRLAPGEALHQKGLGEALLAGTGSRETPARLPELMKRAEAAFTRAQALDPLSPDHTANLARFYRRRSELDADPAAARRDAEKAAEVFAQALALTPGNTLLLDETAQLDYQRLGDFTRAEQKLQRSLELDPSYEYTHVALGDLYLARGRAQGSRDDLQRAAAAYQAGLARRSSLKGIVSLGIVRKELGDTESAIRAFEQALAAPPPPSATWTLHEQLAALYLAKGDARNARGHAAAAIAQAPDKEKAPLEARLRAAQLLPGP